MHPDHFLNCQEAIADALRQLDERAVMAGWGETEVAGALVDTSDCHMLSLASNLETERMLDQAIKGGLGECRTDILRRQMGDISSSAGGCGARAIPRLTKPHGIDWSRN